MSKTARFQVLFEVGGDGAVKASLQSVAKEAQKTAQIANDSGREWEEFGEKIGGAMKYAGAAVLAGVALIARNTIQAEKEMAQLDATLRSTGEAAGWSRDQLVSMAEGMAGRSLFSAGEIVEAETRLLSYTNVVGEVFPRALQAALDQSQRLGIGVEQSAEIIGKAIQVPSDAMQALARQGFYFTAEQEKLIETLERAGKTAEAQGSILDMLEESYGGAAEAARNTFGGALDELVDVASDLITGRTDGEGLQGAREAVESLVQTLQSDGVRSGFGNVVEGAFSAINALATFIEWTNQAFGAAQRLTTMQFGGTGDVTNLKQIRYELAALDKEQQARKSGAADTFLGNLGRGWASAGNILGMNTVSGMSDKQLNNRIAEAKRLESMSLMLFGDGAKKPSGLPDYGSPDPSKRAPAITGDPAKKSRAAGLTDEQRAARELQRDYDRLREQLDERIALFGKEGEVAQWRYDLEKGELSALEPQLKAELQLRIARIDQFEQEDQAREREIEAEEKSRKAADEHQRAIQDVTDRIADQRAELTLTAEQYEVYTAQRAAGVDATAAEVAGIGAQIEGLQRLRETRMVLDEVGGGLADLAEDAVMNFDRAGQAGEDFADRMKRMAIRLLAEKAIQWLITSFMGGSTGTGQTGSFTYSGDFGFADGGYTGPGGKYQPAGIVHAGEYVLNQDATRRIGVPALDRLNRGYASGGLVMPAEYAGGAGAVGGGVVLQMGDTNVTMQGGANEAGDPAALRSFSERMNKENVATARRVIREEMMQGGALWRWQHGN